MTQEANRGRSRPARGWAIYCRVSTEEQKLEGASLDAQQDRCRQFLKGKGFAVADVFVDEGKSGKDFERPEIDRLMRAIESGDISGICVWKFDRLSRSVIDLLVLSKSLNKCSIGLLSVTEGTPADTPMGKFQMVLTGGLAELERDQISMRTRDTMRYIQEKGGYVGGPVPVGLRIAEARNQNGYRFLEADPSVAPRLVQVWPMASKGISLSEIAHFLRTEHIQPNRGVWSKVTVGRLLRNKRYVGLVVERGEFEAAVTALNGRFSPFRHDGRRSAAQANAERPWRLQGIARCAKCGSPLVGRSSKGKMGKRYPYLACNGRIKYGSEHCNAADLPADQWEDAVVRSVVDYIQRPDLLDVLANELADYRAKQAPQAEKRDALVLARDREQKTIANMVELVGAGDVVASAVAPTIAKHKATLDGLEKELEAIEGSMLMSKLQEHSAEFAAQQLILGAKHLLAAPIEQQAMVLKGLLSEVCLARGVPVIRLKLAVPLGKKAAKEISPPEAGRLFSQSVTNGDLDGT